MPDPHDDHIREWREVSEAVLDLTESFAEMRRGGHPTAGEHEDTARQLYHQLRLYIGTLNDARRIDSAAKSAEKTLTRLTELLERLQDPADPAEPF